MFFKDFVSVKRKKIKKGASQTYDTPSICFYNTSTDTIHPCLLFCHTTSFLQHDYLHFVTINIRFITKRKIIRYKKYYFSCIFLHALKNLTTFAAHLFDIR